MSIIIVSNSATPAEVYDLTLAFQRTGKDFPLPQQITTQPMVAVAGTCLKWTSPGLMVQQAGPLLAEFASLSEARLLLARQLGS